VLAAACWTLAIAGEPPTPAPGPAAPLPPPPTAVAPKEPADVLFDLARFVEWPPGSFSSPGSPFVVGILGEDPFGPGLDRALARRQAHGRSIVVRRFRNLDEYRPCQLLYVGRAKARLMSSVLEFLDFLGEHSVLTVSVDDEFVRRGGVVRLSPRPDGSGFDFEINRKTAEREHLVISSELLELAKVEPPPAPPGAGSEP
jgi:hypothetical protein